MRKFFGRDVLDLLIEFTYLAIIFIVPLYFAVWFPSYNIFELNKLVLFKVGVWFLLLLTIIKVLFYYPFAPFHKTEFKPLNIWRRYLLVPSIFIVVLSLTCLFAVDPKLSFFGSYTRQEGLLSYWFYFLWLGLTIFSVVSVKNVIGKNKEVNLEDTSGIISYNLRKVIVAIVLSSGLVSLYGILQYLGIDALTWPEPPLLTHRTFSSLGQPNYLASWLLLCLPLTVYLLKINKGLLNKFWPALILSFQLFCLFFTASRGAWLGLIVTGLLFIAYYLWHQTKISLSRKILFLVSIILVTIVLLFAIDKLSNGRISDSFSVKEGSVAARLNFWSASLPGIAKKPIFGYGLDNYSDIFVTAYQPNWAEYGNINSYPDRAHNFILDVWLGSGIIGLIAWLVLFIYLYKLISNNANSPSISFLNKLLLFSILSYILSLMFNFSFVAGNIYLFLFVAILICLNLSVKFDKHETIVAIWPALTNVFSKIKFLKPSNNKLIRLDNDKTAEIKILVAIAATLIIAWQIVGQAKVLIADHYFNSLYYNWLDKQYFTAFILDDYIVNGGTSYNNQDFYNRYLAYGISDAWPQMFELSVRKYGLNKLATIMPNLSDQGYENATTKAKINGIIKNFPVAEKYLKEALRLGPNMPRTYVEAGRVAVDKDDSEAAIASYKLALSKFPDFASSFMDDNHRAIALNYRYLLEKDLGDIYFRKKNYLAAEKYYQLAYVSNTADFTLYKKIADTCYARQDFDGALYYNELGFKRNPNDYAWPLSLSLIYKEKGDKVRALENLNRAIRLAPDNKDLEKMRLEYVK